MFECYFDISYSDTNLTMLVVGDVGVCGVAVLALFFLRCRGEKPKILRCCGVLEYCGVRDFALKHAVLR